MKKLLSLICMLLCLFMVVSCFAGCGGKQTIVESEIWEEDEYDDNGSDSAGEEDEDTPSGEQNDASDKSSSGGTTSNGKIDFKGATITISAWGSGAGPSTKSSTYKKELELVSSIEKKYNCKIKWTNVEDSIKYYNNFVTAAMAGTKFADIAKFPGDQAFPNAIAGGYVWQLDSFMKGFDDITMWSGNVDGAMKVNGKHYLLAPAGNGLDAGLFFNQDVFDKLGVSKTPHDYMDEGNWNWNTFLELAKACTKKDGATQYYGLANYDVKSFIKSNGGSWWKTNADGSQSFNFQDPLCIEGIQFSYDLFNVHKVIPAANGDALFESGYVAMDCADAYHYFYTDFKYAEVPIGPKAKDYVNNTCGGHVWGIPKAVKEANVKSLLAVLTDYVNPTYKWRETMEETIAGYLNDDKSIDVAIAHVKRSLNQKKYWNTYYPWTAQNVYWTDFGISKQQSPAAFIQSVQVKAEAEINSLWKQTLAKTK